MTVILNQNDPTTKLISIFLWAIMVAIPLVAWKSEKIGIKHDVKIILYTFYPVLISFMSNTASFSKVNPYFILFSCLIIYVSQYIIVSQTGKKEKINENSMWVIISFIIAFVISLTGLAFLGDALNLNFYSNKKMVSNNNYK